MIGYIIIASIIATIVIAISLYRVVPSSEAHYVVSAGKTFVCSPDEGVRNLKGVEGSRWYFMIPILRTVRILDVTIKELVVKQETYEKNQARFRVASSVKYRIKDVKKAAETFIDDDNLKQQLQEVVTAGVRAITVKYDVVEARANKKKMDEEIRVEIEDDLQKWGLELVNFQLIDFRDTDDSKIISDISRRREVEIETRTREENAEKKKSARIKEAEAEELAKKREIEKDQKIAEREQTKEQLVAEKEKLAEEKRFEVIQVQTIKQAEIDKEKAIVKANEEKETELIQKEQKRLEGEGDKLKAEEIAKGEAAPIREKGFAEAEAKEKLQEALKKFDDKAIRALVAEQIVDMQKEIGVETAKALEKADLKVFSGGTSDAQGFELGKIIESTSIANSNSAEAILNKIARPNDLGLTDISKIFSSKSESTLKPKKPNHKK